MFRFGSSLDQEKFSKFLEFVLRGHPEFLFKQDVLAGHQQLNEKKIRIICSEIGNKVHGLLSFAPNVFDSKFFDQNVWQIHGLFAFGNHFDLIELQKKMLDSFLKTIQKRKNLYVLTRVLPNQLSVIRALEEKKFQYLCMMVDFKLKAQNIQLSLEKTSVRIRKYQKTDLLQLKRMCGRIYQHSRFHVEERFADQADRFHQTWVKNACEGGLADQVWVASRGSQVLGFHAFKTELVDGKRWGKTVLIGVDNRAAGKGIGRQLVLQSFKEFSTQVDSFRVRTEASNFPAVKLYQNCGFQLDHASLYYRYKG